jgi:hypothetical protein
MLRRGRSSWASAFSSDETVPSHFCSGWEGTELPPVAATTRKVLPVPDAAVGRRCIVVELELLWSVHKKRKMPNGSALGVSCGGGNEATIDDADLCDPGILMTVVAYCRRSPRIVGVVEKSRALELFPAGAGERQRSVSDNYRYPVDTSRSSEELADQSRVSRRGGTT